MKLEFQFEDSVFVISNFLSKDMYESLHATIMKNNEQIDEDVKKTWDPDLIGNYKPVYKKILDPNVVGPYSILLRSQTFVKLIDKDINFIAHKMPFGSGIQWHDDRTCAVAATLYLNKNWNDNWGGELMWKHNGSGGFIPVQGNTLVLMKPPVYHKVNPVLSKNIARYSIQSFIT